MANPAKPNTAAFYPPSKTALLLLDFHNHFVNMIQPAEERETLLSSTRALINAARDNSVLIVHCQVDFGAAPAITSKVTERWETTYRPLVSSNPVVTEELADFLPPTQLNNTPNDEVTVVKVPGCVSAMKSGNLLSLLHDKYKVDSLVLCGLITSGAVLSTAREAADLGFVTTVVQDGCWDYNSESHEVILKTVLPMTAWVVDTQQGLDLLRGEKPKVSRS